MANDSNKSPLRIFARDIARKLRPKKKRKVGAHFSTVEMLQPESGDTVLMDHFRNEVFFFIKATR